MRKMPFPVASFIFFSGILLLLPFCFPALWQPAWVGLIPFFIILQKAERMTDALKYGFWLGVVFFLGAVFWLYYVAVYWMLFAIAYLALYFMIFSGLVWFLLLRKPIRSPFQIVKIVIWTPLIGVALEWCRLEMPVLGFGWALLGATQVTNAEVLQFARIAGVFGLSALVYMVNACVFVAFFVRLEGQTFVKTRAVIAGGCLVIISAIWFAGSQHLRKPLPSEEVVRVGLIQPNTPQLMKWDPAYRQLLVEKTTKMIQIIAYQDPDFVILPEAVYPGLLARDFSDSDFGRAMSELPFSLLIGSPHMNERHQLFNSAFFIQNGNLQGRYDKMHLVPFGEFIPFESFFAALGLDSVAYTMGVGNFSRGTDYTTFSLTPFKAKIGTLICFEDTIPEMSRAFVRAGANLLVNITNDAWFGDTTAPWQHLQSSILRAVENGCYVMRAANTGISAVISPKGQVEAAIEDEEKRRTFVMGMQVVPVSVSHAGTFFQEGGYLFPRGIVLLLFLLVALEGLFQKMSSPGKKENNS